MKRVTGLGGVFFKAEDPNKLAAWYEEHLGIKCETGSTFSSFPWRDSQDPEKEGLTVWALFPRQSNYFDPSNANFMLNYRVDNLDSVLEALRAEGVTVDPKIENTEYGRFGWIMDPEGNRVELWEPPKTSKQKEQP
jgi:predicted enzyme related to lactoylglutathione lyase